MEDININDYKVIVFEDGRIVFKGSKEENKNHGDYIRDYVDMKISENEYNINLLNQIKGIQVLNYMASNVILVTKSIVLLNTDFGSMILLRRDVTDEEIEFLKNYSSAFDAIGDINFEEVYVDENRLATDQFISLDDSIKDLPFSEKIDAVVNILREKQVNKGKTR